MKVGIVFIHSFFWNTLISIYTSYVSLESYIMVHQTVWILYFYKKLFKNNLGLFSTLIIYSKLFNNNNIISN